MCTPSRNAVFIYPDHSSLADVDDLISPGRLDHLAFYRIQIFLFTISVTYDLWSCGKGRRSWKFSPGKGTLHIYVSLQPRVQLGTNTC